MSAKRNLIVAVFFLTLLVENNAYFWEDTQSPLEDSAMQFLGMMEHVGFPVEQFFRMAQLHENLFATSLETMQRMNVSGNDLIDELGELIGDSSICKSKKAHIIQAHSCIFEEIAKGIIAQVKVQEGCMLTAARCASTAQELMMGKMKCGQDPTCTAKMEEGLKQLFHETEDFVKQNMEHVSKGKETFDTAIHKCIEQYLNDTKDIVCTLDTDSNIKKRSVDQADEDLSRSSNSSEDQANTTKLHTSRSKESDDTSSNTTLSQTNATTTPRSEVSPTKSQGPTYAITKPQTNSTESHEQWSTTPGSEVKTAPVSTTPSSMDHTTSSQVNMTSTSQTRTNQSEVSTTQRNSPGAYDSTTSDSYPSSDAQEMEAFTSTTSATAPKRHQGKKGRKGKGAPENLTPGSSSEETSKENVGKHQRRGKPHYRHPHPHKHTHKRVETDSDESSEKSVKERGHSQH